MPKSKIAPQEKETAARLKRARETIDDVLKKENVVIGARWCKVLIKRGDQTVHVATIATDFIGRCQLPEGVMIFPQVALEPSVQSSNGQ